MYYEKTWGGKITWSNKILLLAIFCAFFISISTTYASDMSYNINDTNFEKIENLNNDIDFNTCLNSNEHNDVKLNSNVLLETELNNNEYDNVKLNYPENIVVQSVKSNSTNIMSNVSENENIEKDLKNLDTCEYNSSVMVLDNYEYNSSVMVLDNYEYNSSVMVLDNYEYNSSKLFNLAAGEYKPSKLSQSSILTASSSIISYVSKNGKLPNSVKISGYEFSMPEYLYLASKAIQFQYKKTNSQIKVKYNIKNPKKPIGTNIKMKISPSSYYTYATKLANFISKHYTVPNYLKLGSNKVQYQTLIYILAKALAWTKANGNKLPSSLSFNIKKNSKINKYMPKYSVDSKSKTVSSKNLNSNYNDDSLKKYLSSSKNCQVSDNKIKSLSSQITKKYKSTYDKAKAIFNWVRDKVGYSFYYNTKYGAKKTMTKRLGNCVDQSHLIVALSRAAGIASRYVHGTCKFLSGNTYGHVWAQIKVGNTWYVADSTSSKNSFGVVKNWYTSSYTLKGIYSSLNF